MDTIQKVVVVYRVYRMGNCRLWGLKETRLTKHIMNARRMNTEDRKMSE